MNRDHVLSAAFPTRTRAGETEVVIPGLSRLEYVAARALQGILSNQRILADADELANRGAASHKEIVAELAVSYAKFLLKECEREAQE